MEAGIKARDDKLLSADSDEPQQTFMLLLEEFAPNLERLPAESDAI
jgi:hypothetical protein